MFGNRILFVLISVFFAMIMNVSMVPIHEDDEFIPTEIMNEDEHMITTEIISETTAIPDVVTDNLLFFEVTVVPFDKSIKTDDNLLYYKQGAVPFTPQPDEPLSFTAEMPHAMGNISYDKL